MNNTDKAIRAAVYEALSKSNPGIVNSLKNLLRLGQTPAQIRRKLVSKYGEYNLTVNAAILAAQYLKEHPELLNQ